MRTALWGFIVFLSLFTSGCERRAGQPTTAQTFDDKKTGEGVPISETMTYPATVANTYPVLEIKPGENIIDRFFLVRPPAFIESCRSNTAKNEAVLIYPPETKPESVNVGDDFYILSNMPGIVKGTLQRTITTCEMEFNLDKVPFGILQLDTLIDWPSDYVSFLAVKGGAPAPDMLGLAKRLAKGSGKEYAEALKRLLPANENFDAGTITRIIFPGLPQEYDFLSVAHYEKKALETLGDKAVKDTGFLFLRNGHLIFKDDSISNVFGVTDLDKNSYCEVLVHSGGNYAGSYEIRLFDGKRFSETKKVLYRWMD